MPDGSRIIELVLDPDAEPTCEHSPTVGRVHDGRGNLVCAACFWADPKHYRRLAGDQF